MKPDELRKFLDRYANILLDIPLCERGKFKVVRSHYEAGHQFHTSTARKQIFAGIPNVPLVYDHPRFVHKLQADGQGTMMSDDPLELADHVEILNQAHGKVLIGGLGLGYIPALMHSKPEVKQITIVEIEPDIVEMIRPHLPKGKITVVQADLFEFLKTKEAKGYNCAYFDIWYPTGENACGNYVVPLRRLAARIAPRMRVSCWGEAEMIGQFASPMCGSLYRVADADPKQIMNFQPHWVFRMGVLPIRPKARIGNTKKSWSYDIEIERENKTDQTLLAYISFYLYRIGSRQWEDLFGGYWDKWKRET